MNIDQQVLDDLIAQAKASPRLRMNYDLRNTPEDNSQRMLNALEPGTVIPIHRHLASSETVVLLRGRIQPRAEVPQCRAGPLAFVGVLGERLCTFGGQGR